MAKSTEVSIDLLLNSDKFNDSIKKTEVDTKKLSTGFMQLTAGSAVLGALGVSATKMAMEFEQSFAKVSTMLDENVVDFDNLKGEIKDLAVTSGLTTSELNEGLYSALSAGIKPTEDMSEALTFLESATKLARGGFTTTEKAVDATTTVMNAYGLEVDSANKIMDNLITTQNLGKTTVDELAQSLSGVIPTAAALGINFDQVSAAMVVMTAQGVPTSQAVTSLNALFAELGKEGTNADKMFQQISGQSFTDFIKSGGDVGEALSLMTTNIADAGKVSEIFNDTSLTMDEQLQKINETTGNSEQSFIDMFGSIEAAKAAMILGSEEGANYATALDGVANGAGAVDEAAEKMETTQFALDQAMQAWNTTLTNLGEYLLPLVDGALRFFTDNANILVPVILIMTIVFGVLLIVLGVFNVVMATAGIIIGILTSPITLVIIAIGLLIGAFVWAYENIEFVTTGVNEFVTWMKDLFIEISTKMKEEIDSLVAKFWEFYNNNKETIDMLIMIFKLLGEMFFTYFVAQIKFGIEMVIAIFGTMVLYVKAHLEAIIGIAWGFISVLIGIFTGDAQMIKDGFVQIFKSMANLVGGIMNSMIWGAERMLNAIIGGINSAIGLMNKIPGVNINFSVGNLSLPRVPSLAIGTNEVLSDGLANIHKGEAIVPANVVKGGFNASGGIGGQDIVINIDASNSVNPDGFERTIMDNIDYAFGKVKGER